MEAPGGVTAVPVFHAIIDDVDPFLCTDAAAVPAAKIPHLTWVLVMSKNIFTRFDVDGLRLARSLAFPLPTAWHER
jgi:hypothetical protein